jgi:putative colanic acid biosynthesis acetyltransferase WcaF
MDGQLGVTVGEGAVVTARSSLFDDVPPWMVASGNPATPVCPCAFRYESEGHCNAD